MSPAPLAASIAVAICSTRTTVNDPGAVDPSSLLHSPSFFWEDGARKHLVGLVVFYFILFFKLKLSSYLYGTGSGPRVGKKMSFEFWLFHWFWWWWFHLNRKQVWSCESVVWSEGRSLWESLVTSPDLRIQHGRSAYPQLWKLQINTCMIIQVIMTFIITLFIQTFCHDSEFFDNYLFSHFYDFHDFFPQNWL